MEHLKIRWHLSASVLVVTIVSLVMLFFKNFVFSITSFCSQGPEFSHSSFFLAGDKMGIGDCYASTRSTTPWSMAIWPCLPVVVQNLVHAQCDHFAFPFYMKWWLLLNPHYMKRNEKYRRTHFFQVSFLFYLSDCFRLLCDGTLLINFLVIFTGKKWKMYFTNLHISMYWEEWFLGGVIFEIRSWHSFWLNSDYCKEFLSRNRKYAVVIALILCVIITPSGDTFSLTLVTLPLWLL